MCERWCLKGVAIHLSLRHTAPQQRHSFNLPLPALFPPTHGCDRTHIHRCVYTYGVTLWQKPRGVPQGSVLFPFSFSPSSLLPHFSLFFTHSLPQDKQVVKSNESSTSALPPSLTTNKPTRGSAHKATTAIRRWFNMGNKSQCYTTLT